MNTKQTLLFLAWCLMAGMVVSAQYSLTTTTGTYNNLNNSIPVNGDTPWDDPE